MPITDLLKNTNIPYVIGGKSSGNSGLPLNVKVSIDPALEKTVIKAVTIFSVAVGLGVASGIVISKSRRK